jgi:hypothetical protein
MTTKKTHSQAVQSTSTPSSTPQIQLPPKVAVPVPPEGYDPNVTVDYRSAQPRQGELTSIAGAAKEVGAFPDWVGVFGKTAPPAASVEQGFTAASQWSTLLVATTLWFNYVRASTALAWQDSRALVEGLKAPYDLACSSDPTLATANPSLTRLLGNAKAISKKAVATRKANAQAVKEGKPPTHGKVGKARKKRAAAAAYDAATTAPASAPPPVTVPAAPSPAVPPSAAPVATNGVTSGVTSGASTNGAAHS